MLITAAAKGPVTRRSRISTPIVSIASGVSLRVIVVFRLTATSVPQRQAFASETDQSKRSRIWRPLEIASRIGVSL